MLRAPSQKTEYRSVNAPWTYFLSPACPDPRRGIFEPGHRGGGDQGADQPRHVRGQGRRFRQAGLDEPVRHDGTGHVRDQLPAPLHRHMLEDDGEGTSRLQR